MNFDQSSVTVDLRDRYSASMAGDERARQTVANMQRQ